MNQRRKKRGRHRERSKPIKWTRRQRSGAIRRKKIDVKEIATETTRRTGLYLLLILLLLILSSPYWGWKLLERHNILKIERVTNYVIGELKYLSNDEVDRLTKKALGENFIGFDVGRYQEEIESEPWIKEAKVERQWFDQLKVTLVEERPVAIWNDDTLIDKEGVFFTPAEIPYHQLPRVVGDEEYKSIIIDKLIFVTENLKIINLSLGTLILDERLSWSIVLDNGILLVIGTEDFEEKFNLFMRHYQAQIEPYEDEIVRIDFRHRDGFAVRRRSIDDE